MKSIVVSTLVTAVILVQWSVTASWAQSAGLTESAIQAAINYGSTRKPSWGCGDGPECLRIGVGLAGLGASNDVRGYVFTPIEWLKWQAYLAAKNLQPTYIPSNEDMAPVLRVITRSFRSGTQYRDPRCDQVSNVVLRDVKKTVAIQPLSFTPAIETYQNGFGAELHCVAANVTFRLDDLESVRRLDPAREFVISVATGTSEGTKDWKVKKSDFSRLQ